MRRVVVFLIPILLLGLAYAAYSLAQFAWDQVAAYHSPFLGDLPSGEAREPLPQRVVIIMVDALRLDASREMTSLNRLRGEGVDLASRVGQPSLSLPGWTVIGSGAWQEVSGVTTNFYEGPVPVDNIFAEAQRAGLVTALVGTDDWQQLYGQWVDEGYYASGDLGWQDIPASQARDEEMLEHGLAAIAGDARLVLIYIPGPDDNGHWFGGTSPEYKEAVQRTDEYIGQITAALDLQSTALIITADHGMTAQGGHGGWEEEVLQTPLVMVGAGVGQGLEGGEVGQADIAPTIAVLLGIPIPTHSQGFPLLDYLEGDERLLAERAVDAAAQQAGFWRYYVSQVGGNWQGMAPAEIEGVQEEILAAGEFASSRQASQQFIMEIKEESGSAKEARLYSERLGRLPIALAIAILPVLYLLWYPRKRELILPLVLTILFFLVAYALYFGFGFNWSLSSLRHESQILAFIRDRLLWAALLSLGIGLLVGFLLRQASGWEVARAAVHASFFIAYALILQIDLFYLIWGVSFTWYLPDLMWGFKYYLDLFQLVGAAGTAIFLPILALGARWAARRMASSTGNLPSVTSV